MKRLFIQILSHIFPKLTVQLAYQQLTSPRIKKLREHELALLETAQQSNFTFGAFDIRLYEWPGKGETILLIHGWEGQAGNFADLIPLLLQKDYHVIAFDGPSHGFSSKGKTSLFEFNALVTTLIQRYAPSRLLSHSFGGVATTSALYELPDTHIQRYALLTTPDKFMDRINDISQQVGINEKVKYQLIERLQKEVQTDVSQLNVSTFVQKLNVDKALIIHDKNDRVIPIQQSRNVAQNWPNCEMLEIEGTGHFRILRTPAVLQKVVAFLE
ncbi:MAG: alpha/beta hydrolase [Bacteroidota bacterium]